MRGNLFVVFMPFQLFVAQQIIRHEKLKNCILLEGYRNLFGPTYDLMYIGSLWRNRINFEDIALFNYENLPFLKSCYYTWKNYSRLNKILKEKDVDRIYLGEAKNMGLRFIAKIYGHKGYRISYFEEGTSHYSYIPTSKDRSWSNLFKIIATNIFYYYPLYHTTFAEWKYYRNRPIEDMALYRRYSIRPCIFTEPYDVTLPVQPMMSEQMQTYLSSTMGEVKMKKIELFMTDPVKEYLGKNWEAIYSQTLQDMFASFKGELIFIKFHHRETDKEKALVTNTLQKMGINYKILALKVNIPVEYYLQMYHFDKIYMINASTFFYNGWVYPKMEFVFGLPYLYRNALKYDVPEQGRAWMEKLLNMAKKEQDYALHRN